MCVLRTEALSSTINAFPGIGEDVLLLKSSHQAYATRCCMYTVNNSNRLTLYRGCTPVVDKRYEEGRGESPSMTIIDALATAKGVDATALPPLFEVVDPDALDSLFSDRKRANGAEAMLSFSYDNWNVFVSADGRIRVCDRTQPTDPEPVFESSAD